MLRTIGAAALTLVTSALLAVQIASMAVDGGVGPALLPNGACAVTVVAVSASGAAGLRAGDTVQIAPLDNAARVYLETGSARAGSMLPIPVIRDGAERVVRSPGAAPSFWFWFPGAAVKLIIFAVGLFVLWRGRDAAAWLFGASSIALAVVMAPAPTAIASPAMQAALYEIAVPFAELAALLFYLMIARLTRPFVSSALVAITTTVAFAGLTLALADNLSSPEARIGSGCVNPLLAGLHAPAYMAALVSTLVLLTAGFVKASGDIRRRMRWIVVSTIVGFSGVIIFLAAPLFGRPIAPYPVVDLTAVAIPLGYAYAIMRHRVIDVGFAINRAIVFTAMSSVVVAAFALLSGALERAAVGPSAGVALQVIVALAVALSFNALEKRVEAAIDRLFFRRKHEAQAALARLSEEAPFVHALDVLAQRAVAAVRRALGAGGVAIYLSRHDQDYGCAACEGAPFPEAIAIDDPLFVRLRASLRDLDEPDVDGALAGKGSAFPLAAQGRLVGAMLCGHRADDEPYDPDERAALRGLAMRLAAVIESLRAREYARLVKAIADGSVSADGAMRRAKDLLAAD